MLELFGFQWNVSSFISLYFEKTITTHELHFLDFGVLLDFANQDILFFVTTHALGFW